MMGDKKLSTIRNEIRAALAREHEDPIAWLESQISAAKRRKDVDIDVLESLKRMLIDLPKEKAVGRPVRSRK